MEMLEGTEAKESINQMRSSGTLDLGVGRGGKKFLLLLFLILLTLFGYSDDEKFKLQIYPYLDYVYTTNVFWDSTEVSDNILSPGVEIDYSSNNMNFYLDANGMFYTNNNYLNYYSFMSGVELFKSLGGRDILYVHPTISINSFNYELSYLNNISESLTLGFKKYITKSFLFKAGFQAENKNYSSYDSYDHLKASSFVEVNKFLQTQTTIRIKAGLNYLYFPHIYETEEYLQIVPNPHNRGRGSSERTIIVENSYSLYLPIFHSTFRIAQSIGTLSGVLFEYNFRKQLVSDKAIPDLSVDEWVLTKMNDNFFWDGSRISFALKTTKLFKTTIAAEFSYYAKTYNGIYVRDLVGEVILPGEYRKDTMYQATFNINRSFGKLNLYIKTILRDNNSNDNFFNYNLFTIIGGIDYNF